MKLDVRLCRALNGQRMGQFHNLPFYHAAVSPETLPTAQPFDSTPVLPSRMGAFPNDLDPFAVPHQRLNEV